MDLKAKKCKKSKKYKNKKTEGEEEVKKNIQIQVRILKN